MKNEQILMIAIIIIFVVVLFGLLSPYSMMCYGYYGGMMSGFSAFGFMWLFGCLFVLLLIIALVLFIVWLIKQLQRGNHGKR